MRRYAPLVALAIVLVAVPLAFVARDELAKSRGQHVLLRVEPIDPHDILRGEYVALSYRISRLGSSPRPSGVVYVPLHKEGVAWTGDHTVDSKPDDGTFIRGRATDGRIVYGIEAFDVQEGTARRYERAVLTRRLYADVVLDDDGKARLDDLVIR